MKEDIKRIWGIISVLTLLFLSLSAVSAHIDIIDMGMVYDGEDHYGYVDYQNTANYSVSGAILVFIDGGIVAGKMLDMPIRSIVGFRCSPIKTLEFPITETEGEHTIVVYILSMNNTVGHVYDYYAEGVAEDAIEESEQEEDWLSCWGFEG